MTRPSFDFTVNIPTMLAVAGLLAGGVMAWSNTQNDIGNNLRDTSRLEAEVDSLAGQVDALTGGLDTRVRALELGFGRFEERLEGIAAGVARIEQQLGSAP